MHALDALGNPTRRAILRQLRRGPLAVNQIAEHFPVSRPAISRHLRVLQDAGLVELSTEGTRSLYTIRARGFDSVRAYLDDFWDVALQRLARRARR